MMNRKVCLFTLWVFMSEKWNSHNYKQKCHFNITSRCERVKR